MVTGRVTKHTPNQSITIRTRQGRSRDFDLSSAQADVDPNVKVGSRVRVSETSNKGQRTILVEPMGAQRSGNRTGRLPQTGSELPLIGLLGLTSLVAGAGARFAARKLG